MKIAATNKIYNISGKTIVRKAYSGNNLIWCPSLFCRDYTTFSGVDPENDITISTNLISVDTLRYDAGATVIYDSGSSSGFGTSFIHYTKIVLTGANAPLGGGACGFWGVSSAPRIDMNDMIVNLDGFVMSVWANTGVGEAAFNLYDMNNDVNQFSASMPLSSLPITKYIKIVRYPGFIDAYIYDNFDYSDLWGSLSIEGEDTPACRYLYAVISVNNSVAIADTITLNIGCLDTG